MTTIAWDGMLLAADSLVRYYTNSVETSVTDVDKIFPSKAVISGENVVAISGTGFTDIVAEAIMCIEKGITDFNTSEAFIAATRKCLINVPEKLMGCSTVIAIGETKVFSYVINFKGLDLPEIILTAYDKKTTAVWSGSGHDALIKEGVKVGTINSLQVIRKAILIDPHTGGNFVQIYDDSNKLFYKMKRSSFRYKVLNFVYGLVRR
jgi:hypothetical protein